MASTHVDHAVDILIILNKAHVIQTDLKAFECKITLLFKKFIYQIIREFIMRSIMNNKNNESTLSRASIIQKKVFLE